ncbi:C-terminal binding protein [Acuticoccus sp. I52.16.1]|uniref:C-terminal binding protein n=1 Tax=Acuticoccus sp. I52.16.1 TaxID=2928472 RepID=UPI001FD26AC7|nr:C-terminal binding protein [Acuticoccus sp. I52.16.1]UOM33116.1 C-terminal binding protein [Acuticoccus sp. I52.16.1]
MTPIVLAPDATPADLDLERAAAAGALAFRHFNETDPAGIPDEAWRGCDAVLKWKSMQLTAEVIAKLERCRFIVRVGVGTDNIDIDAARACGIPVANVPNYGTTEVADHGMALLLSLARGIEPYQTRLRADLVNGSVSTGVPTVRRLRGAVFGCVGLGRIGSAMARRARGFDMDVVYFDPALPSGHELGAGLRRARDLDSLLAEADVVSLHAPLTEATRGLMNAARFAAMKPGATLVNIARGPLVDLDALEGALRSGHLAAAGLDVLPEEPPTGGHPLLTAWQNREPWLDGRLAVTPDAAYFSAASYRDMRTFSVETLRAGLLHGEFRDVVNPGWEAYRRA